MRSHADRDDDSFYAVASQIAAQEARRGHNRLAGELKEMIDAARRLPFERESSGVTPIARPRGELSELVSASYPEVGIEDMVASAELATQIAEILAEQRQRRVLAERGFVSQYGASFREWNFHSFLAAIRLATLVTEEDSSQAG